MDSETLERINQVERDFEAAPKGVNNTGTYLEYLRGAVFEELIPEIERLQATQRQLVKACEFTLTALQDHADYTEVIAKIDGQNYPAPFKDERRVLRDAIEKVRQS